MCLGNCGHNSAWLKGNWIVTVLLVTAAGWFSVASRTHTQAHTHTVIQITLINGEKLIFSHRNEGRSLSLSLFLSPLIAFPFSATHSSCSQLCADRLKGWGVWEGGYFLLFTCIHFNFVLCAKVDKCVLASKLVNASVFIFQDIRWAEMCSTADSWFLSSLMTGEQSSMIYWFLPQKLCKG